MKLQNGELCQPEHNLSSSQVRWNGFGMLVQIEKKNWCASKKDRPDKRLELFGLRC